MGGGNSKDKHEKKKEVDKYLKEALGEHTGSIDCMAVSEDGSLMVTGSDDHTARMWSTKTDQIECLGVLQGHTSHITNVYIKDTHVVTGSNDMTIRMWDMLTCDLLYEYVGHESKINNLLVTDEFIFSSSMDKTAKAWMFDTKDLSPEDDACTMTFKGHKAGVYPLLFLPAEDLGEEDFPSSIRPGDRLITGSLDAVARCWSFDSGACLRSYKGHDGPIMCLALDPTGEILFTGSHDKTIISWEIKTGQKKSVLEGHQGSILSMHVENRILYSSSSDGTARSWVTEFGENTRIYRGHKHSVNVIKFHNGILFTGCGDTFARAYDAKSGTMKRLFKGHENSVNCLIAVDEKLFTGGGDGKLMVWDTSKISEDLLKVPGEDDDDAKSQFSLKQQERLTAVESRLDDYVGDQEDYNKNLKKLDDDIADLEKEVGPIADS